MLCALYHSAYMNAYEKKTLADATCITGNLDTPAITSSHLSAFDHHKANFIFLTH
jgi:hypothetical protein